MLIDTHVHVGQYEKKYFSPQYLSGLMKNLGVNYYVVSSTTMCEENYVKVLQEIRDLQELDGESVIPVMWITPNGLNGNIAWFLESEIHWKCLKVHPFLHKTEWNPDGPLFQETIDIARELGVPLLIHTGTSDCCRAKLYKKIIKDNPDIIFILAHGKPLHEAIEVSETMPNAYVDSAFMSIHEMKEFLDNNLSHKLLWGTDMCIPRYFFPNKSLKTYYLQKMLIFQSLTSQNEYDNVMYKNAMKVFKLKETI